MARTKMRTPEEERAAYTYLTPQDVAERLGCTPTHVSRLVTDGKLRAINIAAGARRPLYRIKPEWLSEFEAAREVA